MKKIFILVIMAFYLITLVSPAWAESGEKVEISFKVGDDTLKINGKDVKVEKPYVVNGVTFVPLRVITEAFGAEVNWDSKQKSILIKYSGVAIKLFIDNKGAVIDDKSTTLLEAPAVVDGTAMVPFRFITENLGADVKFDTETSQITVTKEIAGSNSIKDFSMILKKTIKERVGDSYNNWSINLPKDLKISYRDFNGTYNSFVADDESYEITLTIKDKEDETLDSLLISELKYAKDYIIVKQGKQNQNGCEYIKVVYKKADAVFEYRAYIEGEKIYDLLMQVGDYNKYRTNSDYTSLLDSFDTKFVKDGKTEDLSDVTAQGYRPYEDKKLKWSMNVQADWAVNKDEDKENEVNFTNNDGSSLFVSIFSIENGLTLDNWIEDEIKDIKDDYNPKFVKLVKVEEILVNNVKAKRILTTSKINGKTYNGCDIYMMGKNYRYKLEYWMNAEDYNDKAKKAIVENMANSFKFIEPSVEDIGQLVDPDKIVLPDSVKKLENKEYKWSLQMPVTWIKESNDNGSDVISYSNKDDLVQFWMSISKKDSPKEIIKAYEQKIKEDYSTFLIDSKETKNEKGAVVTKSIYTVENDDIGMKQICYVLSKNGYNYFVYFLMSDFKYSKRNIEACEKIWQSIKFE